MGETTNQIEWEIAQRRSELSDNLIELKQRAKAAVDWRSQVEERPGTMLAVAFGGGIVLSALFSALRGPARVRAERSSGNAVKYGRPTFQTSATTSAQSSGKPATAIRTNLDALGGALLGIVATRTSSILEGILPGFQREFERARNSQGQI
jgi:hypothetical protein